VAVLMRGKRWERGDKEGGVSVVTTITLQHDNWPKLNALPKPKLMPESETEPIMQGTHTLHTLSTHTPLCTL